MKDVIQSPDFGACLSHCGNIAKSENGKANAIAKPNMPIAGANKDLPAASTSSVPIIGPVQEKETMTNVKAISKMLRNPPVERALLSKAVDQESGSVISNSPKNERANTTNRRKKKIFTIALVLRSLRADAPNRIVTKRPNPTYKTMMLNPYKMASLSPPPFFRKNETVIGIIGHTQGVKMANKPPKMPNINMSNNERSASNGRELRSLIDEYSQISGAVHILSSQALKRIGVSSDLASVTMKESAYSSGKSCSPNSMIVICQPSSICAISRTLSPISSPDQ